MIFRVRWEQSALAELADLLARADPSQRQAITSATHQVDELLRDNASNEGESREGRQRILFAPPLVITFAVEADGKTASVLTIHTMRRRNR